MMENESGWLLDVTKGAFQSQYILGDIIGRGSTSTIHSCLHKGRKKYACKIMPKARLNRIDTGIRLQALLSLRHNNIISVKEVYDDPLRIFVIEDLAFGGELLERLASRGGYSERDAANAVQNAAAALEYIHSLGFCHGSLRPEKLLYATDDEDSRLVLAGNEATTIFLSSYKVLYCAPEVIAAGKPGAPSDLWSLGIILYIMLCGFEPFRKTEEMFPSPYWDDKTDEAKRLITQLMQEEPKKRPTASDLLANSWVRGEKTAQHFMTEVAQHLREFNARRKFKAATLAVRATHRALAMTHCHGEHSVQLPDDAGALRPVSEILVRQGHSQVYTLCYCGLRQGSRVDERVALELRTRDLRTDIPGEAGVVGETNSRVCKRRRALGLRGLGAATRFVTSSRPLKSNHPPAMRSDTGSRSSLDAAAAFAAVAPAATAAAAAAVVVVVSDTSPPPTSDEEPAVKLRRSGSESL